jgi:Ran GTPase-activating protein (RanGAP) involved in mRNA processing and transport
MPISQELEKLLDQISKNKHTNETLSLLEQDVNDEGVEALSEALKTNEYIKEIDLSNNKISPNAVKFLCNAKIARLNLSGNPIKEGAALFAKTTHIQELLLAGCSISDSIAQAILKNIQLKRVDLSGNDLGDEAVEGIPDDSRLEALMFNHNNLTATGAKSIAKHKNIIELLLGTNRIGDEGIVYFADNDKLQILNLMQNGITKKGFFEICKSTSIKTLILFNNKIEFDKKDILPENFSFVHLSLSGNRINSSCERVLIALVSIPTLQELDLNINRIDGNGMKILYQNKLNSLERIDLVGNPIHPVELERDRKRDKERGVGGSRNIDKLEDKDRAKRKKSRTEARNMGDAKRKVQVEMGRHEDGGSRERSPAPTSRGYKDDERKTEKNKYTEGLVEERWEATPQTSSIVRSSKDEGLTRKIITYSAGSRTTKTRGDREFGSSRNVTNKGASPRK